MIYLDYSATTPVNEEVIDTYSKVCRDYIGNPNSLHKLGVEAKKLIDASTLQIAKILGVKPNEIIYTSGSSEANNLAIKGVCSKYNNRGKHIITTELEHSSVIAPISYLQKQGFEVDFVKLDENGLVDLNDLKQLLRDDTILVSICAINSEVGIKQDLKAISDIIRTNPKTIFHSDVTQLIGKDKIDFSMLDLASISGQKFYGMKPATPLIVSLSKALRLAYDNYEEKYNKVVELNKYLIDKLSKLDVSINSNSYSLPHIVNVSIKNIKPETMQHALEEYDIFISTQTACSKGEYSKAVYAVTRDKEKATHSIRISLSYLTTYEELDKFIEVFTKLLSSLNIRGE